MEAKILNAEKHMENILSVVCLVSWMKLVFNISIRSGFGISIAGSPAVQIVANVRSQITKHRHV